MVHLQLKKCYLYPDFKPCLVYPNKPLHSRIVWILFMAYYRVLKETGFAIKGTFSSR